MSADDIRHTSPTSRPGRSPVNAIASTPLPRPASAGAALAGNSVTPSPPATICARVGRLVARSSVDSVAPAVVHTASA